MEYQSCLTDLIVYAKNRMIKISYEEIILLRMDSGYVTIEMTSGKTYLLPLALNTLSEILPDHFFQLNRSEIVNIKCCTTCNIIDGKGTVKLHTGECLTVSRRRISYFKERFIKLLTDRDAFFK